MCIRDRCITGGEPLINDDIISLIKDIHSMGYSIKLDTNGSFPDKLYNLIDERLLDYVAMDIKNSPEKYDLAAGVKVDIDLIDRSVQLLKQGNIAYEFRTTIIKELHTTNAVSYTHLRTCVNTFCKVPLLYVYLQYVL